MNRKQRRKEKKHIKENIKILDNYSERVKETYKAYSECTEEILSVYNQWVNNSFISESIFLDIIDNNILSICISENELSAMCWLEVKSDRRKVGEPFVSQSINKEHIKNFKTDLALILLHIASVCNNETNKNIIRESVEKLFG